MMTMVTAQVGQLITILIMAVALGLDAFSLGIGIGLRGIRLLDILKISMVISLFHVVMPLIGMFTGHYVSSLLGSVASLIGGCLLMALGAHMIYSSLRGEEFKSFDHTSLWGLLIFALSVSIDSFSVGVSLGLFASDIFLTVVMFGTIGGLMSIMGLMVGRKIGNWAGGFSEAFGGVILLVFGIKFLL